MKKIYIATTNKGKLAEIQEMFDIPLTPVELEIDEVQSMDLEYVARRKAEVAYLQLQKPVIVDDVGLYLDAMNGFPGPFIKHMFDSVDYDGFLEVVSHLKNRKVRVAAAIGYHDGEKVHVFVGEFTGKIASEKRGTKGWGFDPIVIPDGYTQTYAEMGPDIKNKISHRARALARFKEFLDSRVAQKV